MTFSTCFIMTLAIDIMDGCCLSNTAHCESLLVLATEGTPNSSYKTEQFSYKGEWENA